MLLLHPDEKAAKNICDYQALTNLEEIFLYTNKSWFTVQKYLCIMDGWTHNQKETTSNRK